MQITTQNEGYLTLIYSEIETEYATVFEQKSDENGRAKCDAKCDAKRDANLNEKWGVLNDPDI